MLVCEGCGLPIPDGEVEWINKRGVLLAYHTGARYDPNTCAYIARHSKEHHDHEAFVTRLIQDEFMR